MFLLSIRLAYSFKTNTLRKPMGYITYSTGSRFVVNVDVPDDVLYPDPHGI